MANPRAPQIYKVIIIGTGLVGSSTFYQAAKLAKTTVTALFSQPKVLAIEQFSAGHTQGSSHGESRITRLAIGEGEKYVDLAKRSHGILIEVEKQTKECFGKLLNLPISGLIVGPHGSESKAGYHGSQAFLDQTLAIAKQHDVSHQFLDNASLQQAFPQFNFNSTHAGYLEQTMGYINPDACIKANIKLAKELGGELHEHEKVKSFEKLPNGKIKVTVSKNGKIACYITEKLIITAGPWLNNLVKLDELKVYRESVFWFKVKPECQAQFDEKKFPTFIWHINKDNMVYGFPLMGETDAIKIGSESYSTVTTPETVDRAVSQTEINDMYEKFIKPNFPGISKECVKAMVCLYTVAPEWKFLIDFLPGYDERIIVASPCSGHGAKHAPAIGEALAQQSLWGRSNIPVIELFGGLLTKAEKTHAPLVRMQA